MAHKVYSCDSSAEAHFVCGLLRAENIDAEVRGDTLIAAAGVLPIFGGAEATVWIHCDDKLAQAEGILKAMQKPARGASWICPRCHEEIEAQFTDCWRCPNPE